MPDYCKAFWSLHDYLWKRHDEGDPRYEEYKVGQRLAAHLVHCKRCKRHHPVTQARANSIYWEAAG